LKNVYLKIEINKSGSANPEKPGNSLPIVAIKEAVN